MNDMLYIYIYMFLHHAFYILICHRFMVCVRHNILDSTVSNAYGYDTDTYVCTYIRYAG